MGNPESPHFDFDDKESPGQTQDETVGTQPIQAPVANPSTRIPTGFDPFGVENGKPDARYN